MKTQEKWIKLRKDIPNQRMKVEIKCKDGVICTGTYNPDAPYFPWFFDDEYADERFLAGFRAAIVEWRPLDD